VKAIVPELAEMGERNVEWKIVVNVAVEIDQ
jgi:hypothetical protein